MSEVDRLEPSFTVTQPIISDDEHFALNSQYLFLNDTVLLYPHDLSSMAVLDVERLEGRGILSQNPMEVWTLDVNPSGDLAAAVSDTEADQDHISKLALWDLRSMEKVPLAENMECLVSLGRYRLLGQPRIFTTWLGSHLVNRSGLISQVPCPAV